MAYPELGGFRWEEEMEEFDDDERRCYVRLRHQDRDRRLAQQRHLLLAQEQRARDQLAQEQEVRDRHEYERMVSYLIRGFEEELDDLMLQSIITQVSPAMLDPALSLLVPVEEMVMIHPPTAPSKIKKMKHWSRGTPP